MAPRNERGPTLRSVPKHKQKVGSSSVGVEYTLFANARVINLPKICKRAVGKSTVIKDTKGQDSLVSRNKRKVASSLKQSGYGQKISPLTRREEIMAQQHQAMMWKLKSLEVRAHAKEMKKVLLKQNKEIRRKRLELRKLKEMERELRRVLEQCESQSQELSVTSASLVFRSNLNRIYMLAAALLSFLLVRIFSYSHLV
ncbi:hypothetical protein G9A89_023321 [Geosiphon pyriformis]|nr:hypothetical protein G9A89_023321 [Geosiphon pyriformis]